MILQSLGDNSVLGRMMPQGLILANYAAILVSPQHRDPKKARVGRAGGRLGWAGGGGNGWVGWYLKVGPWVQFHTHAHPGPERKP